MSESVDLNDIDWNNLEPSAFQELHKKFSLEKPQRKKRSSNNEKKLIQLGKNRYEIPLKEFNRFKVLKNENAKIKFRENILKNYSPISEL